MAGEKKKEKKAVCKVCEEKIVLKLLETAPEGTVQWIVFPREMVPSKFTLFLSNWLVPCNSLSKTDWCGAKQNFLPILESVRTLGVPSVITVEFGILGSIIVNNGCTFLNKTL